MWLSKYKIRREHLLLLSLILLTAWIRLQPFVRFPDWRSVYFDYDEGVYLTAAISFAKGLIPYRDFFFVHPPGVIFFWAPFAYLFTKFSAVNIVLGAKLLGTLIGTCNAVLVWLLLRRVVGLFGAFLGAAAYSIHYGALLVDRGVFLENLVSLFLLACLLLVIRNSQKKKPPFPSLFLAGACLAATIAIKATAIIIALPLFLFLIRFLKKDIIWLVIGGLTSCIFCLLAIAQLGASPQDVLQQIWFSQTTRPPDGDTSRLTLIFHSRLYLFYGLMFLVPWGFFAKIKLSETEKVLLRSMVLAMILLITFFFTGKTFWSQYLSIFAVPQAIIAGIVTHRLYTYLKDKTFGKLLLICLCLGFISSLRSAIKGWKQQAFEPLAMSENIELHHKANACLFSFEPGWMLLANQWPSSDTCKLNAITVDPYGSMLVFGYLNDLKADTTLDMLRHPKMQALILDRLSTFEEIYLGERGRSIMTEDSLRHLSERNIKLY